MNYFCNIRCLAWHEPDTYRYAKNAAVEDPKMKAKMFSSTALILTGLFICAGYAQDTSINLPVNQATSYK